MNQINYMGLSLKNPVVVAAGPWSRNAESINRSICAGAAAVATETITFEQCGMLYPRIFVDKCSVLNTTLYSTTPFEDWEQELACIEKNGSYVICTIRGSTPSELNYIATRLERWGADALELCPFNPIGTKLEGIRDRAEDLEDMLRCVVNAVKIPISVRLPSEYANSKAFAKAVERSGALGISTIEPQKGLWGVDLEKRTSKTPTFGGYCGAAQLPVTLATVATLSQLTNCQISAMGGIRSAENALECIMLGATAVQLGSTVMLNGHKIITEVVRDLEAWLCSHGVSDLGEIRGAALYSLTPYEDIRSRSMTAKWTGKNGPGDPERLMSCIRGCMEDALSISPSGQVCVDTSACSGCGLCASLAPDLFEMQH